MLFNIVRKLCSNSIPICFKSNLIQHESDQHLFWFTLGQPKPQLMQTYLLKLWHTLADTSPPEWAQEQLSLNMTTTKQTMRSWMRSIEMKMQKRRCASAVALPSPWPSVELSFGIRHGRKGSRRGQIQSVRIAMPIPQKVWSLTSAQAAVRTWWL